MNRFASKIGLNKGLYLLVPFGVIILLFIFIPLLMIIIKALTPVGDSTVAANWLTLGQTAWGKIGKSLLIAVIATVVCILLSYPLAYFVARAKSKKFTAIVIVLITTPIWSSLLIKLIGLRVTFQLAFTGGEDLLGQIWTIIGVIYVYIPFMILPLITSLRELPDNLLEASKDLGRKPIYTFFAVTMPWTRIALISGVSLVFLPAMTTVAIPQFLDRSSSGQMIGNIVYAYGERGFTGDASLANAASLSIVVSAVMFAVYLVIVLGPRLYALSKRMKISKLFKNQRAGPHAPPIPAVSSPPLVTPKPPVTPVLVVPIPGGDK